MITDPAHTTLILQRKDDTYPVRRYRGALACFGGQVEPGESPSAAVRREITEEIIDRPLAGAVLTALRPVARIVTASGHHVSVYAAVLPDFAGHAARIRALPQHQVCAEGHLEILCRRTLAGQPFAWNADALLCAYLRSATEQDPW